MPQFILNEPCKAHPFHKLDSFAKGYVEAMFFTNCDSGHDDEFKANKLGVERLTHSSVAEIETKCAAFWKANEADLQTAMELEPGNDDFRYARESLDETRLGHLFWYASQGHGVGFTDDGNADCLERLQEAARKASEAYPQIYNGWIHFS